MRMRVVLAVAVVLLLSYGLVSGWSYARHKAGLALRTAIEGIETVGLPQFEVARETRIIRPAADRRLTIENPTGRVQVLPGGADITAEFTIYARGKDSADAARRAKAIQIEVGPDPDAGHEIRAFVPDDEQWPSGVSVDFTVTVPPQTALTVHVVSADARVTGIAGGVVIRSASGDVSVTDGPGPVTVSTASGDIRVTGARVRTKANASSGDISLSGIAGKMAVHTTSGDISLSQAATQEFDVSSTSGDLSLALTDPLSGVGKAHSLSGDVTVAIPPGSDCRVALTTLSGDISDRLGLSQRRQQRRTMAGILGAGRGSLDMSTTSGDTTLRPAG
jgi:hypothetical protein